VVAWFVDHDVDVGRPGCGRVEVLGARGGGRWESPQGVGGGGGGVEGSDRHNGQGDGLLLLAQGKGLVQSNPGPALRHSGVAQERTAAVRCRA
jgi:hypothetical protein